MLYDTPQKQAVTYSVMKLSETGILRLSIWMACATLILASNRSATT